MAKADEVLAAIAGCDAAMHFLETSPCAIEGARPPKTWPVGTTLGGVPVGGTLVLDEVTGLPVDEGGPGVFLADLVRAAIAG